MDTYGGFLQETKDRVANLEVLGRKCKEREVINRVNARNLFGPCSTQWEPIQTFAKYSTEQSVRPGKG